MSRSMSLLTAIAIDPSILAFFVLVTCLTCLYMVFFFGRRLQNSAYLRNSLVEGVAQQELKTLLRELHDRAVEGPLDSQSPPPDGYGPTGRLWETDKYVPISESAMDWHPPNETPEEREERLQKEEKQRQFVAVAKKWEADERVRYENRRQECEKLALERAEKRVPTSFDISLLGGGYAFLLEFSTVMVIIFTLLILGILKIMEGKDISTILAAIAGYVLGKATSGSKAEKSPGGASGPDPIKLVDSKPRA